MAGTWWKDIDELKAEQSSLLDIDPDTNLLIKGPPGSGKTNLLLLRANQLAIGERPNLHVVVFGSLLKQFIQLGGAQYSFPPEKVVTHARLFADILRAEGADIDSLGMTLDAARAARASRLKELVDAGKVGVQFDALLLDEAQDYTAEEIRLFRGLTEVLVATADQRQRIYDVQDSSAVLKDCVDTVHELKYHFRNGLEICRLADGLHKGVAGYVPMQQYSNYEEAAYPSKVLKKSGLSLNEQAVAIAAQATDQRFAYPDDLIGVLCPTNADLDVIEAGLHAAGLGHDITRANDHDQFDSSRPIWLSTLTAAKGLEFRAVHIAGLDNLRKMGGAQKRLIFTGITRAKTALTLYWHKSIPGYLETALLAVSPPKGPVSKKQILKELICGLHDFPRREVLELMLSANEPARDVLKSITGVVFDGDPAAYHAFWTQQPGGALPLPELLVVPDGTEGELLVALNASPHAPSPMTSLTRVLTGSEAHALFSSSTLEGADDTLPSAVALAMVEAVVLSDGRVPLRQVTPALCKRTLSFAWGKALAASSPAAFMEKLPSRWIEAYGIVNSPAAVPGLRSIVSALIGPLGSCAQLGLGLQPAGPAGKLAHACLRRDRLLQERAWAELAQRAGGAPSLDSLASATREERGSHLQQMLKLAPPSSNDDSMAAACAFLATQVAPGSLEHFDVLRGASNPSVAFWYALYASLQTPSEILSGLGGLGLRVIRDVSRVEEPVGRPTADIAFSEIKALERVGIDVLGRKFGHLGEVEVELIPFVTSSFSFHARSARARNDVQAQLPLEEEAPYGRGEASTKAKLRQAVAYLNEVLRDLPDSDAGEQVSRRSSQSSPKRSRSARDRE